MGLENSTCDRCNAETNTLKGSYFNLDMLCVDCNTREQNHSDYQLAKEKELEQVKLGNLNYEGIGRPADL